MYSGLSFLSLSFLVSGFTWRILYSVSLTGIGYYGFVKKTAKKKEREEKTVYTTYSDL
ncbi:hypothetical protein SDC9_134715 [bioreactor metagenome]|uniref:Uncharacterized protein n=1 Tax=bioreactor metagenome TaxID=1076179 RepID=A0A645DEH2_9ZZZZ